MANHEALRAQIAALRLRAEIAKGWDSDKHPRYPKGDPQGGKFSSWFSGFFGQAKPSYHANPHWAESHGPVEPFYTLERKGSVLHTNTDDKGRSVYIFKPSQTTPADSPDWKSPDAIVGVTPGDPTPKALNGVPFNKFEPPEDWRSVAGQVPQIEHGLPDLESQPGLHPAAGVIVQEPDGRVWLTRPTNGFGGYRNTFPKGTQEHGLTLQQTAIKEAWEETGLKVEIVGVLGDFQRTTSMARYYVAKRVGGSPQFQGWESQAMRLVPPDKVTSFLNVPVDRDVWRAFRHETQIGKERSAFIDRSVLATLQDRIDALSVTAGVSKAYDDKQHPRWPKGSPLGGKFMAKDAAGITTPPQVGSASNQSYQKKADAAYAAAKKGDVHQLEQIKGQLEPTVGKYGYDASAHAAGKVAQAYSIGPHTQAKYAQGAHQYVTHLIDEQKGASHAKLTVGTPDMGGQSVPPLSAYKNAGAKPGGSNPGGVYVGPDGNKYLVKGANHPSDDRAKNEVLASKLMLAAGVKAPEMHLVQLGDKYGGGLGVASKMEPIKEGWHNTPMQRQAAQQDFATHAWLANYDATGTPAGDNLAFTHDGKLFNYDPGGALLFRAQGMPKDLPSGMLPTDVSEWNTMRNASKNAAAHSVYGDMTSSDLANSAEKLKGVDDKTITDLVSKYGPGTPEQKLTLAHTLIQRRDDVLYNKAGLPHDGKVGVVAEAPAKAAAKPTSSKGSVMSVFGINVPTVTHPDLQNVIARIHEHALAGEPDMVSALGSGVYGLAGTAFQKDEVNAFAQNVAAKMQGDGLMSISEYAATPEGKTALAGNAGSPAYGNNISAKGQQSLHAAMDRIEAHTSTHGVADAGGLNAAGAIGLHDQLANAKTVDDLSEALNGVKDWHPKSAELQLAKKHLVNAVDQITVSMGPNATVTGGLSGNAGSPAAKPDYAMHLTNTVDGHNKFYKVEVNGTQVTRTWGKIGTTGQTTVDNHATPAKALNAAAMLVSAKLHKGYESQPITYGGSNYAGANEARHEAAAGKLMNEASNATANKIMVEATGFNQSTQSTPLGQHTLAAVKAFHAGDDKAMATHMGQIALGGYTSSEPVYDKLSALAQTKADKFPLATGGSTTNLVPPTVLLAGEVPTKAHFADALGHTGVVAQIYADSAAKLSNEGVGGPSWASSKKTFEGISTGGYAGGAPGTHPNKPAADLILHWMGGEEAKANVAADAAERGHAVSVTSSGHPAYEGPGAADWKTYTRTFDEGPKFTQESKLAGQKKFLENNVFGDDPVNTANTKKFVAYAEGKLGITPAAETPHPASIEMPPPIPSFQMTGGSVHAKFQAAATKMHDAYLAGDKAGIIAASEKSTGGTVWAKGESGNPITMNGKLLANYQKQLLDLHDGNVNDSAAAELAKPVGTSPAAPGTNKGALPAMPKFEDHKLPDSNSNAPSHNKKVDAIAAAAASGDATKIFNMKFGTNTYGKKQAKLANDALAAMGVNLKVTSGKTSTAAFEAANSAMASEHTAAALGSISNFNQAAKGPQANFKWLDSQLKPGERVVEKGQEFGVEFAKIQVPPKGLDPAGIPVPPDHFKIGTQGDTKTWLSSKAEVNQANNDNVNAIYATGKAGDVPALEKIKVKLADGKLVSPLEHPAKTVVNYYQQVLAEAQAQTSPTFRTATYGSFAGAYKDVAQGLSTAVPEVPYSKFSGHADKAADYLVLNRNVGSGVPVPQPGQFKELNPSTNPLKAWRAASTTAEHKLSYEERSAISNYIGSGYHSMNQSLRDGHPNSQAKVMMSGFNKAAIPLPEGSILWRGIGVGEQTYKSVVGAVVQDGSFQSSSYGSNPAFSSHQTWLRIHTAADTKALSMHNISSLGEREVIVQNNIRYLVMKVTPHTNFVDSAGKSWGHKTIVDLLALPH